MTPPSRHLPLPVLDSIADRLRERETDLKQSHKQTEDLTKQLDHPFEHEEKLTAAAKRQQEIVEALDITKNQASSGVGDSNEAAAESPAQQLGQTTSQSPCVSV